MYAGAAEEFAASALFIVGRSVRYPCSLLRRVEPGATPGPATNRVTSSLGTERACKACAFVPAWFDSRVTHHVKCGRSWKVEHLSATQEIRFRLPTSAPSRPVSKSGDCTRLKSAGGQFKSGAGHHFRGRQRAAVDPCKIDVRSSTLRCSTISFPSSHLGEGAPLLTEEGTFESCGGSQSTTSDLARDLRRGTEATSSWSDNRHAAIV